MGRSPWQVLSCVVVVWRTHRGQVGASGLHGTDLVTLNLCVMRRYNLGEGDLVSTYIWIYIKQKAVVVDVCQFLSLPISVGNCLLYTSDAADE